MSYAMEYDTLDLTKDDAGVARLTLARPDKHNALSAQMLAEVTDAAARLAADQAVRVVVLGAQGKSYCAGGDLAWMRAQFEMDAQTRRVESAKISQMLQALDSLPQPLIGAVQGNAFGGAMGLLAVCDVVIAVDTALFAFTETRLGLIPANIAPFVLRRMGPGPARQVLMSARIFAADEAQRLGLVRAVVPQEALAHHVDAEVQPYLSCAPGAVAETKTLLRALGHGVAQDQMDIAAEALAQRWQSVEAQTGIAAFFDKSPPPWQRR